MPARQDLASHILKSKYSKYLPSERRRETFDEVVTRVEDMMLRKYPEVETSIRWAYKFVRDRKILGSQRVLQFGGEAIERRNSRMFNCCGSFADRVRFFQEAFWLLLCGCGVGFSVQKHHVARLPRLLDRAKMPVEVHVVADSIEGWADAAGVLIESYLVRAAHVEFDYGRVRPKGSPISTGGKAPGHEPLANAIENVRRVLDRCGERLRPIDVFDIVMHLADAVLSGGVRRSATICLFSPDDEEMATSKTGNWYAENPQRARANISALRIRGVTTIEEYRDSFEHTKQWGEPGDFWGTNQDIIINPCGEVGFWPCHEMDGVVYTGWHFCNLTSINMSTVKSRDDFLHRCRAAAVIGTLQAGFTEFTYLGMVSEEIARREALLGVSMTGMMDKPEFSLDGDLLEEGVAEIIQANKKMAAKIGINEAARATAIKPEGTGTLLLGDSLANGRHPWPFRRGIRHIQENRLESIVDFFKDYNPHAVERSLWSANATDDLLAFPITAPEDAKIEDDFTAMESLKQVKFLMEHWINPGRRDDLCTQPWVHNSVSNTIKVGPDEWEDVMHEIFENSECYAGVSLLARTGDKDYRQAPNVSVLTPEELDSTYGEEAVRKAREIVRSGDVKLFGDLWDFSDALLGMWPTTLRATQVVACNKVRTQVAEPFMGGDLKRATHCLKDVYYADRYDDLVADWKSVPYDLMIEDDDQTNVAMEPSCVGGTCTI